MTMIHVTTRDGSERHIDAAPGRSLMRALKEAGVNEVLALCGGDMACGTCHVFVGAGWAERLPPISAAEEEMLAFSDHRRPESRLSCQIAVSDAVDGLSVTIAPED